MVEWKPINSAPTDGWFMARIDREKWDGSDLRNSIPIYGIVAVAMLPGDKAVETSGGYGPIPLSMFNGWAGADDLSVMKTKATN